MGELLNCHIWPETVDLMDVKRAATSTSRREFGRQAIRIFRARQIEKLGTDIVPLPTLEEIMERYDPPLTNTLVYRMAQVTFEDTTNDAIKRWIRASIERNYANSTSEVLRRVIGYEVPGME